MKLLLMMAWCVAASAQQDSISLTADSPPPVRFFGGVAAGQRGATSINYWIVARYPIGTSPPRRAQVTNTVGSQNLTGSNFVRLSWAAMPEATGYDVLRSTSTSDAYPASPSCVACAVVLNTSALTVDDTGGVLSAYPPIGVVTAPRANSDITINNVSEAQPYFNVRLLNSNLRLGLVSSFTAGNCVTWLAGGRLGDAGAACGTGSGTGSVYGLTDFTYVPGSPTAAVVTIAPNASSTTPVAMKCSGAVSKITTPPTITRSSGSASSVGYLYVDCGTGSPVLTFGHNSANVYVGSGVTIATGVTGFPVNEIQALWMIPETSGTWDPVVAANDSRALYGGGKQLIAGSGVTITQTQGTTTISASGGSFVSSILSNQGPLGNVTMTGGGTYDAIFSYIVPGNTLGATDCLKATFDLTNSGLIILRVSWGATVFSAVLGAVSDIRSEMLICNSGSVSTQNILWPNASMVWYNLTNNAGGSGNASATGAENTAAAVTFKVEASGTNPDTVAPKFFLVNRI